MSDLSNFLNKYRAAAGSAITNTSLPPSIGKWNIPDDQYQSFLKLYAHAILQGNAFHMTETHTSLSPILIDIDFKYDSAHGTDRKYCLDCIQQFIEIYNDQLEHYFQIDAYLKTAFVFEKPSPTHIDNQTIKDGFHVMYPYIVSKPDVQFIIRENAIELIKSSDIFNQIPVKNTIDDIIDEAVIKRNGWMMYKSNKANQCPYLLTHIFNHDMTKRDIPEDSVELIQLFSIRNKPIATPLRIEVLPSPSPPPTQPIVYVNEFNDESVIYTRELVDILSVDRCNDYNKWINTGVCLYNINSSDLLNTWIEFSKRSEKFVEGDCEKRWKSFSNHTGTKLTIRSLNMWARQDNLIEYDRISKKHVSNYLQNNLDCEHNDVATLLHLKYQYQYTCSDLKFNSWYEFKNHRWIEIQKAKELRDKISTELYNEYSNLSATYKRQHLNDPENHELKDKIDICKKLLKMVKNTPFKELVMKECEYLFNNRNFEKLLDTNKNLVCFNNGVYDLKMMEFRNGCPDDFITLCTEIDYTPWSELQNSPQAKELQEFISKVLPEPDVRKYVLKLISSFLSGTTGEQKFHIWTGSGSNGKSKLVDLIEEALGNYQQKLPIKILTRRQNDGATPEMAKTKGKRFVSFQEPERRDKIQVGFMKEISGGDKISARAMYKSPIEFRPQFKMLLCCNDLPDIPSNDGGTWRRIRVVDFPSKFVDDPKAPNEFKKDVEIPEKISIWAPYFASMLIEMYKKLKKEGLKEPHSVLKYTKEYQRRSDVYLDYIEDNLIESDDENDSITFANIFNHFKMWHIEYYNERPSSVLFREYMEKRYGKCNKRHGWKKLKFIDEESEI